MIFGLNRKRDVDPVHGASTEPEKAGIEPSNLPAL